MYMHKNGVKYRKIEKSDLEQLWCLKQESWWGTHGTPIMSRRDQEVWFENLGETTVMIAEIAAASLAHKCQEETIPVGVGIYSNIDWVNRSCDLSGSIYSFARGGETSKLAFECGLDFGFEILNMRRIQAEVMEYNLPAQKLEIDHLGFTVEGRRRKAVYKSGVYYDSIILGILRHEWEERLVARGMTNGCNNNIDHEKNCKLAKRALDSKATDQ
jgi:RimJ/RimL family protein N-acetyltransferase